VQKADGAGYEVWPLRFEIDDKGRLWQVISTSIYTRRFDFIRELLQNGIDASLGHIYLSDEATVEGDMPRLWNLDDYNPFVVVTYSELRKELEVIDNGIGMDKRDLQAFLFRVAESGFRSRPAKRDRQFPSIAKFGVGFVACLTRAERITISTRSRSYEQQPQEETDNGRRVSLRTRSSDAYSELHECPFGTRVCLQLREGFPESQIATYIQRTFMYPSVPIMYIDEDKITGLVKYGVEKFGLSLDSPTEALRGNPTSWGRVPESPKELIEWINLVWGAVRAQEEKSTRTYANRTAKEFDQLYFLIDREDVNGELSSTPSVVELDDKLQVVRVRKLNKRYGRNVEGVRILWVPVRVFEPDLGIDWVSFHGMLLRDGMIKASVLNYTVHIGPSSDRTVWMDRDEWEAGHFADMWADAENGELDLYERMERRHDAARGIKEREDDVSEITMMPEGFSVSDPEASDSRLLVSCLPYLRGGISALKITGPYDELVDALRATDNSVFQDGIHLPLSAWWIAPIGACKARCNFTGAARLELNVARTMVDESPTLLRGWLEEIGSVIIERVIESVASAIEKLNCEFSVSPLITGRHEAKGNSFLEHALEQLGRRYPEDEK